MLAFTTILLDFNAPDCSVSETAQLMGFSHTALSSFYTEWGKKKKREEMTDWFTLSENPLVTLIAILYCVKQKKMAVSRTNNTLNHEEDMLQQQKSKKEKDQMTFFQVDVSRFLMKWSVSEGEFFPLSIHYFPFFPLPS